MHLGMLILLFFLYLGIIALCVIGFKRKNKRLKIVSISLLVIAIILSILIGIIYG
ncbi:MAG: hypothetical protein PUB03_04115 [bacterium]|nr:hypothetical protein [bacterium]